MRRATAAFGAVAVVLWAAGVFAQAKPSFAGSWTPDTEKNAAMATPAPAGGGGGRGPAAPRAMAIKQDLATLTIERVSPTGPTTITYNLDGSPMDVTTGLGQAKATAKWDGATIVIEQVRDVEGTPVTTRIVYAIEGAWLTTTTTAPGRGGGAATTTKVYFKKG